MNALHALADPVAGWALRLSLALLFGAAAVHKLRDPADFTDSLRAYRLLPARAAAPAAACLVAAELCAGGALLLPRLDPAGSVAASALLALYAGAIAINLARGRRDIDCGSAGPGRRQRLSGWLLLRNAVLVLAAGWVAVAPTPRDPSWLDAFSLVGSVTLLTLLWSASHRLAALPGSARLAAIRPNPRTHPGRPDRWRP